jgi:hypothetical protein
LVEESQVEIRGPTRVITLGKRDITGWDEEFSFSQNSILDADIQAEL